MSNLFTSIRFILALLTILAIAGRPLIPPKTLVLHPSENTDESIYARVDAHGQALVGWLDKAATYLRCVNPAFASSPPCGVSFNWVKPREAGCIRQTEFTRCSSPDSDPDGDGWGLESGKQCIVILEGTRMTGLGAPFCLLTESDPDGDGKPAAPVPTVLFVHGGPWGRDGYGFNSYAQWLANRGYAVLNVN